MASYANFLPPSIDDYFRIVDPKGKLSPPERIHKMNDVLDNLPRSFPKALCYVMDLVDVTIEQLAEASQISERTISRYRTGKAKSYSEDKIVAMCVAMKLPPWLSRDLVKVLGAKGLFLTESPHFIDVYIFFATDRNASCSMRNTGIRLLLPGCAEEKIQFRLKIQSRSATGNYRDAPLVAATSLYQCALSFKMRRWLG